ncbi:MAG TPA: aminotransferase class V-fold PLP-dependent enzyme [Thermomicrobiales bacterium]|jgi:L-seryl-tRNA(Ser) seleniumtransferase
MDIYQRLGVRPVINAASTYTMLGGSIMAPPVAQAMADAAGCFLNLPELQAAVGRRLAELTHNEAAYVSNGAAAGLALATAACVTGDDVALMARLPNDLAGMKNEIVIHRAHRNHYDVAVRQVGLTLVEIGHLETFPWELDDAITERTAAVVYFAGERFERTLTLPLPYVVERAHARGVPVIVDAAAQVPPVANLWRFTTELGADVAVFSGGKGLGGPQNSGLVVGREPIIRAVQLNGPPVQRIGRAMKVSKEAMIGLLVAVEHYLARDHEADATRWTAIVDAWLTAWQPLTPHGVVTSRLAIGEAGDPIPRIILRFTPEATIDRDGFVAALRAGDPAIEVVLHDRTSIAVNPQLLQDGEADVVASRVSDLLAGLAGRVPAGVGTARTT